MRQVYSGSLAISLYSQQEHRSVSLHMLAKELGAADRPPLLRIRTPSSHRMSRGSRDSRDSRDSLGEEITQVRSMAKRRSSGEKSLAGAERTERSAAKIEKPKKPGDVTSSTSDVQVEVVKS